MTKTTFFSFIFSIPLSYTSQPSFSIVLCVNQKLEWKTCTNARPCGDPILDVTVEMLGNLSFTRRNLVNFYVKYLHFFFIKYLFQIYSILSSERLSKCSSRQHGLLPFLHAESPCGAGRGVLVFVVRPDQEEIVIIVALELKVQLGIKEKSERFVVFTRMNLFLEEM